MPAAERHSPSLEEAVKVALTGCSDGVFYDSLRNDLLVMWRGDLRALWPVRVHSNASGPLISIEATIYTVEQHRRGAVGLLLGRLNKEPMSPKLSMVDGVVTAHDEIDLAHIDEWLACLRRRFVRFAAGVDALYSTIAACAHPGRQDAHLVLQGEYWQPMASSVEAEVN